MVHAYDETDASQVPYIDAATKAGWEAIDAWPPVLTNDQLLSQAKSAAIATVNTLANNSRVRVAGTESAIVIAGWSNKLRIAQSIIAGNPSDSDVAAFREEVALRNISGETMQTFTQKVIDNATSFISASGKIDGAQRAAIDSINAATTVDEVSAAMSIATSQLDGILSPLIPTDTAKS